MAALKQWMGRRRWTLRLLIGTVATLVGRRAATALYRSAGRSVQPAGHAWAVLPGVLRAIHTNEQPTGQRDAADCAAWTKQ